MGSAPTEAEGRVMYGQSYQRVHSPALSESSDASSSAAGSSSRVCRSLYVEAEAGETGVRSTLYCRIALARSTFAPTRLLTLNPQTRLLHYSTYSVPLGQDALSSSSGECLRAARLLGLDGNASSSSRRGSPASSPSSRSRPHSETIRLLQGGQLLTLYLDDGTSTPSRSLSPVSPSLSSGETLFDTVTQGAEKCEWNLVVRLETTYGEAFQAPRAGSETQATIPLPICLRNSLALTLPESASENKSSPQQWDLVTKPPLLSSSSSGSSARTITGSFASTPSLLIRYSPRASPLPSTLTIPHSSLEIGWSVAPNGSATVTVKAEAQLEHARWLPGDQAWLEVEIQHRTVGGDNEVQVMDVQGHEVLAWEVQGQPALSSSSSSSSSSSKGAERSKGTPRSRLPLSLRSRSTPDNHQSTPTPTARPRTLPPRDSRPPSYTNLFDQAPPDLEVDGPEVDLSASVIQRVSEPSLLRQAAPFQQDEGEAGDLTFEAAGSSDEEEAAEAVEEQGRWGGSGSGSASSSPEAPEADADYSPLRESSPSSLPMTSTTSTRTIIRIQVDLASLLLSSTSLAAPVSFTVQAKFPFDALRSRSSSATDGGSGLRLALPSFSLPAAAHEESVVSVSLSGAGGEGGAVELLESEPMMRPEDGGADASPLPASGGRARWRTERRSSSEEEKRGSRSRIVEVQISLPPRVSSRRLELDDLDSDSSSLSASPTPALRRPRPSSTSGSRALQNRPSFHTLRNKTSASSMSLGLGLASSAPLQLLRPQASLGLIKLRITPVPPSPETPEEPWQLFTHLTFPRPFIGTFELPLKGEQGVELCDSWNERGEECEVEVEEERLDRTNGDDDREEGNEYVVKRAGQRRTMRIETLISSSRRGSPVAEGREEQEQEEGGEQEQEGLNELLYCVSTKEKDGQVELGDVLPKLGLKVSSMEVEVLPVAGYDLLTHNQAFDSATPSQDGMSTKFTKFQIPAEGTSRLSVSLQPSGSPPRSLEVKPPVNEENSWPSLVTGPNYGEARSPSTPSPPLRPFPRILSPSPESVVDAAPSASVEEPKVAVTVADPAIEDLEVPSSHQAPDRVRDTPPLPPQESPALPSLPPTPAVEPASQADWTPSPEPPAPEAERRRAPSKAEVDGPSSLPAEEPKNESDPERAGERTLEPKELVEDDAALSKHDPSVSALPQRPFTPASLPLSPSPVKSRSPLATLLRILPLVIFILAVTLVAFAPGRLQDVAHLVRGEAGSWPTFDSAGELLLVEETSKVDNAVMASSSASASITTPVVSLDSTTSVTSMTTSNTPISFAHPSTGPPPAPAPPAASVAAPPLPPTQPEPTFIDYPPPPLLETNDVEEAGFPSVLAEIVASWKALGADVVGWVEWLVSFVKL